MQRGRFVIAAIIAIISLIAYYSSSAPNPVTGESQRVGSITPEKEVALGLQAAPEMAQQFGGLSQNAQAEQLVDETCARLISRSAVQPSTEYYRYECHVLADPNTVNAFALPGGQVFITEALLRLLKTEDELAGVLGHEIGHVVGRHSSEQIAKNKRNNGITMGVVIATSDGQSGGSAQLAQLINQAVNTSYSRDDERESDSSHRRFVVGFVSMLT